MRLATVLASVVPLFAFAGDGAKLKMLKGEPILGMAAIDGRVFPVAAFDDGTWVDPDDMFEVETSTLLFDPSVKPVRVSGGWFQPLRTSYRGAEGWQALRWGMTKAEVRKAMGATPTAKPVFVGGLGYAWTLDGMPAEVTCVFTGDRLAGVSLHAAGVSFDRVRSLLEAKLGEPSEAGLLRSVWQTGESRISLSMKAMVPVVVYASKAFGPLVAEQLK